MSKPAKIALITLGIITVAFVIIIVLAMVGERKMLEKSLNNPIINSDYQGWKAVNLDENVKIKLPTTWKLEFADDRISIVNSSGEQIAVGTKLPILSVEEENAFLETIFGSAPVEHNLLWTSGLIYGNMTSSGASQLKYGDDRIETYVSVDLPYINEYRYFFCFFSDSSGSLYRDEVEAIAYSLDINAK